MVIDRKTFDEIQLALHVRIASRVVNDAAFVEAARNELEDWMSAGLIPLAAANTWKTWFALKPSELASEMVGESDAAITARRNSPFWGLLPPHERWLNQRDWFDRHPRHSF